MKKNPLKSLWWVLKIHFENSKLFLGWSLIYAVYSGLASIATVYIGAKFLSSVTAIAFQKAEASDAYRWIIILLVLEIFDVVINRINMIAERRAQQIMDLRLNSMLMSKMYELSQEQFDNEEFNTKLARARDSLGSMWRLTTELSWLVSSIVRFVSAIVTITIVAPILGVIITVMVVPITLIKAKQNKVNEDINKKVEPIDRIAFRTRWMMIDPSTMPEIRLMNAFSQMLKVWNKNMVKSQNMIFQVDKRMAVVDSGTDLVEPVISFGASVYFLKMLISGAISLDRFIFLRGLIEQASGAATSVVAGFQSLHETAIGLENFDFIYRTQPAIPNGTIKVSVPLTVEFKQVSFAYPKTDALVLNNISFLIVPGSKLALVGENGAGKSTLIKLLLRQYLPTKGTILINGVDIKDVEQQSYYEAISNLSQNFLMVDHLTIKDNLVMGIDREVSDKEIEEVTDMVGATNFINKLKHKFLQRLDPSFDDGTGLSGGQLQRLGVARSLLRGGDLMILDEPTSAIDAKAEYMIFNNIYKNHGLKTTLIVSHRFSTVRKADKIVVMDGGKITEYGSHEELLKYGGLYKEMFEAQAEGYK